MTTENTDTPQKSDGQSAPCSVIFAVSNDGGKTGVAWREDVHAALAYLDLQNACGPTDYCVVAVRKFPQNAKLTHGGDNCKRRGHWWVSSITGGLRCKLCGKKRRTHT